MGLRLGFLTLLFLVSCASPATPVEVAAAPAQVEVADTLNDVIDRMVAAYGGAEALAGAGIIRQSGTITATMRGGAKGVLVRIFEYPQRLWVDISYPGGPRELRVFDGLHCWRNGAEVEGPPLLAVALQAARLGLPLLLHNQRAAARDLGTVERAGHILRAVELPLEGGLALTAEIDPTSGHILRSVGKAPGGIEFSTDYSDFRSSEGVLYAFGERTFAMGTHTGDAQLAHVERLTEPPSPDAIPGSL